MFYLPQGQVTQSGGQRRIAPGRRSNPAAGAMDRRTIHRIQA